MNPSPFLHDAIEACSRGRELLQSDGLEGMLHRSDFRGAGGDLSSGIDMALEEIFVETLGGYGRIESEESGIIGDGESTIILDPLDGSSNALSGFPYYGVSIARLDAEGILREALVANLANGDLFCIDENAEALQSNLQTRRWHRPSVAPEPQIGLFEKAYAQPQIVAALDRAGLKFRAPGAVALSLAYARSVEYFLFVGPFRIYDFAAGLALCRGLEVLVEESFVIVARSPETLRRLRAIVEEHAAMD